MEITRRLMIALAVSSATFFSQRSMAQEEGADFEDLLALVRNNPALITSSRGIREGASLNYSFDLTRSPAQALAKSELSISKQAIEMIIAFEVSSRKNYEDRLSIPTWPGGNSGITIGIGYDLGYRSVGTFREQWANLLSEPEFLQLEPVCEAQGEEARLRLHQISSVSINWDTAIKQFSDISLPIYVARTERSLPTLSELPKDCRGALVSLVYNRGASFRLKGGRFKEMRSIRQHMLRRQFDRIPEEIRAMKRIWDGIPGLRGILIRREMEAQLFEKGLAG